MTPYETLGLIIKEFKARKLRPRWKKPLAGVCYKQARNILKDVLKPGQIYQALRYHTHSVQYLRRMKEGMQRFDFYGQPCGVVTAEEAQFAKQQLFEHHRAAMADGRRRQGKILTVNQPAGRHKRPAQLEMKKPEPPAPAKTVEPTNGATVEGGGKRLSLKLGRKPGG